MQHFPIFLDLAGRHVVLAGGGEAALAKLRLLMKTEARISVFADQPVSEIVEWDAAGKLALIGRAMDLADLAGAALVYAATEDATADAAIAELAETAGVLVNIVDNLGESDFITPAIVDRDPVTVAIGTEGAAPVLARAIKQDLEERLPARLGLMARIGKAFRARAEALPFGRKRRDFWADYYFTTGPRLAEEPQALEAGLEVLLQRHLFEADTEGRVDFVGAGPGDPELLTLKARKALDAADVVIHDRLVPQEILELARREAVIIEAGKTGFGPSTPQSDIDALIIEHAQSGAQVVRLKSGDASVFGRLDEEITAVEAAGVAFAVIPGITAASAAAAQIGQSLTARGRNSELRLLTGHDVDGLAEQDWRALARPGAVAAIYMGKRAARFVQGRLLMHGADPETPVSIVENASRPDTRVITAGLGSLASDLDAADLIGPAVLLYGLAPRHARAALTEFTAKEQA